MLHLVGMNVDFPREESVSILVGPNGSGKSSFLRKLVMDKEVSQENMIVVCNTPHDKFSGISRVPRISTGRRESSPKNVVKKAVVNSLEGSGEEFYQISATMAYCGYKPRFCFRVDSGENYGLTFDHFLEIMSKSRAGDDVLSFLSELVSEGDQDLLRALLFLKVHKPYTPLWIDAEDSVLGFSRSREFVKVLKLEKVLKKLKVIRGIRVYLEREDGEVIEMHYASSGQLTLISTLLFLISNSRENPLVIIDEPENSLHPKWQREYVSHILGSLSYRNARIVIATHSPLIVTGALYDGLGKVRVFEINSGLPSPLDIGDTDGSKSSIEELLWNAFDVVTPSNHFVSEKLVDEINRFERGEVSKDSVLDLIADFESSSFDEKQKRFLENVRNLIRTSEAVRENARD